MVRGRISSILRLQNIGYGTFLDYKLRSPHASRGNLVFIKNDNKVAVFIPIEIMLVVECYEVLTNFRIFNMEQIKKYYASIAELRTRITEIKKQLEKSDEFQTEMQQIDRWLENEDILFAEYDDDIVRYLIESIRVTDDLKLIINFKGGVSVTGELYQKED